MEDNLNCSLDCEDKEMLRRKLALLKMEYSRTAQRLLRAERSQVVRHVKSRITDQNRLNDTDLAGLASPYPNGASPSLHLGSPAATFTDSPLLPDSDTIPVLTENPRRSTMVRFVLPSETTCRLTPDPFLSLAGYRASPAGRLMSRRSRLRLERRNDERMTREMEVEVVEESEELVACSDSESPSLMPSQLMVARGGAMEEQEVGRVEKQGEAEVEESESPSLLLTHWSPATHIGVGKLDVTDKEKEMPVEKLVGERGEGKREEKGGGENERDEGERLEETKREKVGEESLPDSYTVVEGLPFPAEYYVRTTRRMSSSQSQPNLQAVILNQFAGGRQRKGRSRGAKRQGTPRGSNTQANGHSSSPMQTMVDPDSSSTAPTSSESPAKCQMLPDSLAPAQPTRESQSSFRLKLESQTSQRLVGDQTANEMLTELATNGTTCLSPQTRSTGPIRGRRRKRGRGRRRSLGVRRSLSLDADPPDSGQGVDNAQSSISQVPKSQPLPGAEGAEHSPVTGRLDQKVYPIFTRSCAVSNRPQKKSKGSWRSLLLPCSPSPSIFLSRLPPLCPAPLPRSLGRGLANVDLLQDFHLPDDQFALLKLNKLRQFAMATAAEPFSWSPYNTRRATIRRAHKLYESEQVMPLPLPLSLTPTVESSPLSTARLSTVEQATVHFVDQDFQCTSSLAQPPVDSQLKRTGDTNEEKRSAQGQSAKQSVDRQVEKQRTLLSKGLHSESQLSVSSTGSLSPRQSIVDQPCSSHFVEKRASSLQSTEHRTGCHLSDKMADHVTEQTMDLRALGLSIVSQLESELMTISKEQADCPSRHLVQCAVVHQSEDEMPHDSQSEHPQSEGGQSDNKKNAVHQSEQSSLDKPFLLSKVSSGFTSKCPVECPPSTQADEVPKRSPVCPTKDPTTTRSPSPSPKPPAELLADRPAEKEILMASPVDCSTKTPPRASSQLGSLAQRPPPPRASSQLLLSPSLASPTSPLLSPRLVSSALPFSPPLPSIGLTPHLFTPDRPRSSPTSGLPLNLPLSPSPSARSLSPPPLSACPTLGPLPSSPPRLCHASRPPSLTRCCTPSRPLRGFFPPSNQEEPCDCSPVISNQSHDTTEPIPISQSFPLGSLLPSLSPHGRAKGAGGQFETLKIEEKTAGCVMKCTHTIQTPAGGCLVDACCVPTPSGGVCVAAAGEWAVCVWAETSSSHWSLIHTWTFKEPVISVFPVLDAAGLLCVTLGQLEIRQVRVLSCSRLQQVLLREGEIQTAVGVANARVVSSSHSAAGMALQVSSLSQDGSVQGSLPLASPGVFVWALAAVEGLPDALIGSANDALLLVWNTRTGQLLRRISLAENLAHTACLRGFSSCGVLFVLLQHQSLSSPREDEGGARKDEGGLFSAEAAEKGKRSGRVVFSLVATNPLSGKSALATRLGLPTAWSRRLCEADVLGTSVVGVSQCGRLCVWELGGLAGSRVVWDPEDTAWQLARWGGRDSLLVGHNNGDLSFYHCTPL